MGLNTNCVQLIADLFLYGYERDFMSRIRKSEWHDLIDIYNGTSRYFDNIFTMITLLRNIFPIYIQENFS